MKIKESIMKIEDLGRESLPPSAAVDTHELAALQEAIDIGCRDIAAGRSMLFTASEVSVYLNKRVEEILGER